MTVIHAGETSLGQETKPDWCQMPSGGFFRMPKEGGEHDCHWCTPRAPAPKPGEGATASGSGEAGPA
jgi:hypothetical protein